MLLERGISLAIIDSPSCLDDRKYCVDTEIIGVRSHIVRSTL